MQEAETFETVRAEAEEPPRTGLEIAVVGMAGRFPGAPDLKTFWENLAGGVESISFFSREQLLASGVDPEQVDDPSYVPAQGILDGAELFAADFFGYSPREAEVTDPQHRLLLECAWEALEDAGHDPERYAGLVGIYAGVGRNTYAFNLFSEPSLVYKLGRHQISIGNEKDYLCSRIAYKLDLEGPSVVVQSACSTSLLAVHLACQGLLSGECDMALAGGVCVTFPQEVGYVYQKNGVGSPDGHCRAFDARAQGTVGGHGLGIVVLKRLAAAVEDGDDIRAIILGSAVNNDGRARAGFTAPRVDGQAQAILAALQMAEVDPATVGYVEAHGTGTQLGDPIEIAALTQAFAGAGDETVSCAVGSVKTNIGHLDAAAGIAGLIKSVLALQHGQIPPTLHFEQANPEIDFAASPFHVCPTLTPWPPGEAPRRAGVSSFGLGGTNVHVVLEEAPRIPAAAEQRPWHLLLLSAGSEAALEASTDRLVARLEAEPELPLADVAYTTQVGRRRWQHRRTLVCRNRADALGALGERDARRLRTAAAPWEGREVAFLLPGLGDHYEGMAGGLFRTESRFRDVVDECASLLGPLAGGDLRQVLGLDRRDDEAEPAGAGGGLDLKGMLKRGDGESKAGRLARTEVAHPVLFVVEYALARLLLDAGVRPRALVGYSLGEYVAACVAGVMALPEALSLVSERARLIEALPAGGMLAVALSEAQVSPRLTGDLAIAAVNGPELCVVAGPAAQVAELEERLAGEEVACRRLETSHAFHTPMMEPVAAALAEKLGKIELHPPEIPFLSNVTGDWIRDEEATDPGYWVRHLCQTVRFSTAIEALWKEVSVLIEVGPGQSLGSLALQHPARPSDAPSVIPTLRGAHDRREDSAYLLEALAQLWIAGVEVDWQAFHRGAGRRRVALPTYPFERRRFWIERRPYPGTTPPQEAATGRVENPAEWFFVPGWKSVNRPRSTAPGESHPRRWLLLADGEGVADRLAARLREAGHEVVVAVAGEAFASEGRNRFTVASSEPADYRALMAALDGVPDRIVHMFSLGWRGGGGLGELAALQDRCFFSLLFLSQALIQGDGRGGEDNRCEITVVTDGLMAVGGEEEVIAGKATLLGPLRVIPLEQPSLSCRLIDVGPSSRRGPLGGGTLADWLAGELETATPEPLLALRYGSLWAPTVSRQPLAAVAEGPPPTLRQDGVYLITGGFGGIGLALAEFLARRVQARLVLLGRTGLPGPEDREQPLAAGGPLAERIRRLQALEEAGVELMQVRADVADREAMRETIARIDERFGRLDGVFHAAGLPGGGLLALKSREAAEAVLAPKVAGTLALAEAVADRPLDLFVLFSSVAWLTGEIGQVDYCAANAFLSAFARERARRGGPRVMAIDWGQWKWDGWTHVTHSLPAAIRGELARRREVWGLTFEEGMEALSRALASGLPQICVATHDLSQKAGSHTMVDVLAELRRAREQSSGSRQPRPLLGKPYVAPETETERAVAALWEELLGVEPVGVDDDFFDLGGHSLLGIQVLSHLRHSFGCDFPLRTLFDAPTARELASQIEAAVVGGSSASPEASDLTPTWQAPEVLLRNLDQLSEEEMDSLLAEMLEESTEERS